MEVNVILQVYLFIAFISGVATAMWCASGDCLEGVDTFWDWVMYNILWILQPIKALFKLIKNIF